MTQWEKLRELLKQTTWFTKYPELNNGKDVDDGRYPFVERGYSDKTIVAETMRFIPLASRTQTKFLIPQQACTQAIEYICDTLGITKPHTHTYDNDVPNSYLDAITSLPKRSLHVMHPYATIPKECYAVDPDLLLELNNKANIGQLTAHHPHQYIKRGSDLAIEQYPAVIKSTTGSSGDGVHIIHSAEHLNGYIKPAEQYIIQRYIEAIRNYNIQFFVPKQGDPMLIGFGEQVTESNGSFIGVSCNLAHKPPKQLYQVGKHAAQQLAKKGYWGFAGFDVLQDAHEQLYIIDPNIRVTSSTPAYLLSDILQDTIGPCVYVGGCEVNANSPLQAVKRMTTPYTVPLSVSHGPPPYSAFMIAGGNNMTQALTKWKEVKDGL